MAKTVLLLGHTGKMGTAILDTFSADYKVIGKNSRDFDAQDFKLVNDIIDKNRADIVINCVASLGIDPCEQDPHYAFRINTLYPKFLAQLCTKKEFLLVHFSTDAVFNDEKKDFYVESDKPHPLNLYGFTKYGADCFIQTMAENYYIFRIPILFGEAHKETQFVEKMLKRIKAIGEPLKISNDIISSPTYSRDVAQKIKQLIEQRATFGLYHLANEGKASLCELMKSIVEGLELKAKIHKASYEDFPYVGIKNTYTPIKSEKIDSLRPWQEAVKDYCSRIKSSYKKE